MSKSLRMLGRRLRAIWRRWLGRETSPVLVVSDMHIGTTMWQLAMLRSVGVEAEARTLSAHARYAPSGMVVDDEFFAGLAAMTTAEVRAEFAARSDLGRLRAALCSFPPARIEDLEKLPTSVRLVLNVGHRIHIGLAGDRLEDFTCRLTAMAADPRFVLATMSEYDFHYVRYYTGLELRRLPVACLHLARELREAPYAPSNRVVLIGPSHNLGTIIGFGDDLAELNRLSADYARRHGFEPYSFEFIKKVYPGDTASPEKLARHPAVLMNPYSAFSISMVELYQMNIPFFVPADELLVGRMGDVRLHPLYQENAAVDALEQAHPPGGTGYSCSPNDPAPEAQRAWLKHMYFNQVGHVRRWSTPEELFGRLYGEDLAALHDRMRDENRIFFAEQAARWCELLPAVV